MTKEEKQLLLKDLCARLPYGVICHYDTVTPLLGEVLNKGQLQEIRHNGEYFTVNGADCLYGNIKPYLRPMSSMTEEEKADYHFYCETVWDSAEESYYHYDTPKSIDWLIAHHFDYRGLIPMGLALEAPEDMYETE